MKKLIALLLLTTPAFAGLPPTTIQGQTDTSSKPKFAFQVPNNQFTDMGGIKALIETGNSNILPDPGFESGGTTKWTASGGAVTAVNTTAVGTGVNGYDWDSNASGQTLTSTAVAIPAGLKGKNAVVSCNIKNSNLNPASTVATHTIAAFDGTNPINATTINNSTATFARTTVNFIMPSSGTIAVQLKSVAANEPEIYIDDCFIADAALVNLSQVSQAQLMGQVKITGCASGWATNSASLAAFPAQSGCVYTTSGAAVADTTFGTAQLPAIKFSSLPPGNYVLKYEGGIQDIFATAGGSCAFQFWDGTNTANELSYLGQASSTQNPISPGFQQTLSYTTAQSNVTLSIRGQNSNAGSSTSIYGTTSIPGVISVYYFPSQSQLAYRPDATPASWSGTQVGAGGGWSTTSTTYADPSVATTSNTLTQLQARNITCSAEATKLPGITCNLPRGGLYKVCAIGTIGNGTSGDFTFARLVDGSSNIINGGSGGTVAAAGAALPFSICGQENMASPGSATFKVQLAAQSPSTASINEASITPITWTIDEQDAPLSAPYLTGSVTSNTGGQERVERATLSQTAGACTVVSQSGNWIGTPVKNATGDCSWTINTGMFSGTPTCTTAVTNSGTATLAVVNSITPTALRTLSYIGSSNTLTAETGVQLICMGPR